MDSDGARRMTEKLLGDLTLETVQRVVRVFTARDEQEAAAGLKKRGSTRAFGKDVRASFKDLAIDEQGTPEVPMTWVYSKQGDFPYYSNLSLQYQQSWRTFSCVLACNSHVLPQVADLGFRAFYIGSFPPDVKILHP